MSLADRFVAFAEAGNQQRLVLQSGAVLQGWIMEITEDSLLISTGAGETGKDNWVQLSEIDLSSLAYWDTRLQSWQGFTLPRG